MPTMFSQDGRRQRIVPERAVPSYLEDGWTSPDQGDDRPAVSDLKPDWVAYAKTHGYDETEGLTKDELIERYG